MWLSAVSFSNRALSVIKEVYWLLLALRFLFSIQNFSREEESSLLEAFSMISTDLI